MLWAIIKYLIHPRVMFTHLVAGGLLFDLHRQAGITTAVAVAIFEELLAVLLWAIIPNSWATILALAVCIQIYEKLTGPRVEIKENAIFISDDDISDVIQAVSPELNHDVWKQETGGYAIHTYLQYIEYSPKTWAKGEGMRGQGVELDSVVTVEPGADFNISKVIRGAHAEPSQCFRFITNIAEKTISFIAPSVKVRDQWLAVFDQLYGKKIEDVKAVWLDRLYADNDIRDTDGPIKLEEAVKILNYANRPTDKAYVKEIFTTFAKSGTKSSSSADISLTQDNFRKFFDIASRRPEVHNIFLRLLDNKRGETVLNPVKFRKFLNEDEKENVPMPVVKQWIKASENLLPGFNLTAVGFTNHMFNSQHNVMKRGCRTVYQDMHQPLSHYFIATSHNTYLTKDQLRSKSSVDMYTQAFKRGCKCVELDCWDGPGNEPIIYHGHTLTSKIMFKDVIKAVKEHAFAVSDYPVILSFENHCSVEQQKVMAAHLVELLGDCLYTKPVPENEKKLQSPEQLKGYVIVKNKKLKEGVDETEEGDDEFSDEDINEEEVKEIMEKEEDENGNEVKGYLVPEPKEEVKDEQQADNKGEEEGSEKKSSKSSSIKRLFTDIKLPKRSSKKSKAPKLAQELSDLVHYCQAVSFKGFNYAKENLQHYEMSSFGEKKAFKFASETPQRLLEYTRKHLARSYPAGGRVDSSNYDPTTLWNCGCQLVALNYQTGSYPMQLNQGLFQDNGGCGYVLKPQFMRDENSRFDPRGPFDDNRTKTLVIRVISGSQIPYKSESNIRKDRELHILVRVAGLEADNQKEKTKTVKNNGNIKIDKPEWPKLAMKVSFGFYNGGCHGYNPVWDEELEFKLHMPELALVSFSAMESTNTFLGQFTLPVRCLQQGFRVIPLQSKMSETIPYSSLFVNITLKD